jgi:hypothetical protein
MKQKSVFRPLATELVLEWQGGPFKVLVLTKVQMKLGNNFESWSRTTVQEFQQPSWMVNFEK